MNKWYVGFNRQTHVIFCCISVITTTQQHRWRSAGEDERLWPLLALSNIFASEFLHNFRLPPVISCRACIRPQYPLDSNADGNSLGIICWTDQTTTTIFVSIWNNLFLLKVNWNICSYLLVVMSASFKGSCQQQWSTMSLTMYNETAWYNSEFVPTLSVCVFGKI